MSNMWAGVQRMPTVASFSPRVTMAGLGTFHSARITTVGTPSALRGSWLAPVFSPRVTISRRWTPSSMRLARSRSSSAAVICWRLMPISRLIASAPW